MRAISGTGPTTSGSCAGPNSVLHWDGRDWIAWRRHPLLRRRREHDQRDWAAAPNDLWVIGDGISHWLNDRWVATPRFPSDVVGINGPYVAVAGTGPSDVHFLLASGYVVKATNDNLDPHRGAEHEQPPGRPRGGCSDRCVGRLRRPHVRRLTPVPARCRCGRLGFPFRLLTGPAGIHAIWSAPDGTLWAAGKGGALLRRAPNPTAP